MEANSWPSDDPEQRHEAKTMFVAPPVSEPKLFQFALTVMDRAWPGGVRKAIFLPSCERV